jgi:hypothetical protein
MASVDQSYRKKQAFLVFLVFVCLAAAFVFASPIISVGSILVACAICFWASTMEPERAPDDHHHH